MKAGIVTITNGYNYGNRLQNYAVQEALESRKIQAETIWKTTNVFDTEAPAYIRKLYIKRFLHYHLTKEENRILNFHRFNKTYIKRSSYMIDEQIPEGLDSAYDYFIAGSDQVWNPYLEYCTAANFLSFTEREKKVALSPSIAIEQIPEKDKENFAKWLKDFRLLSVREEKGAELIRELTGRNVEVLCDPTMYLSAEKWRNVEKEPKSRLKNSPYILTYFLGDCEASYKIWIENLAEKNHMKIFELQNEENFGIAPDEFLYLIDHAACVCTDSFHGTVFSLIFHTPFVVFERRDNFKTIGEHFIPGLDRLMQWFDFTYIHRFTTAILPFTFLGNYISAVENKWLNEEKMINRKTAKICLTVAILFNCFEIWLAGNMGLSEGTAGSFGVLFVILLLFIVLLQNPLTTEGASKAGKFCRDSSILIYGLHPLVLEAIARRIDVTLPETMLWAITIIVLCIVNIVWTKLWKMRS